MRVSSVWQTGSIDKRIQKGLNATYVEQSSEVIEQTVSQMKEYFLGERKTFDISLLLEGTDFQKSVWQGLIRYLMEQLSLT